MAQASVWSRCPPDVLLSIFHMLDDLSLSECFEVNSWWREVVDYYAKHYVRWPAMAKLMMANNGWSFISKSRLDWRDLYINYMLWHDVQAAQVTLNFEHTLYKIKHLHIYKDLVTVTVGCLFGRSQNYYLKIDEKKLKFVGKDPTTHDLLWPSSENPRGDRVGDGRNSLANIVIKKMIQAGPFKRVATFQSHLIGDRMSFFEDAFYALDKHNKLEAHIWTDCKWFDALVSRYYGQDETLEDLEVTDAGVTIYLKSGVLMCLNTDSRAFEHMGTYYRPHKMLYSEKIYKAAIPDLKNMQTPTQVPRDVGKAFLPFKPAFVASGKQFVGVSSSARDEVHWAGEYPTLTSATQHGDMLLLGHADGKVEIYQINFEVVADPSPPKLSFNIQDYATKDPSGKGNFSVIVIEVFEVKESHRIIIATAYAIYSLVISYPKNVKQSLRMIF